MAPCYSVAAVFRVRGDAIDAMKRLIEEVTGPSLGEPGCHIYHWSQGADDPTVFLLYMEWRDKASFDAHVASSHVQAAEQQIKSQDLLTEPAGEWHYYRL